VLTNIPAVNESRHFFNPVAPIEDEILDAVIPRTVIPTAKLMWP
jgi:hypothetical protein